MSYDFTFDSFDEKEEEEPCRGVFFRYTENNYFSDNKIVQARQLRLLKKRSCPGCRQCMWLLDDVQEGIVNDKEYVVFGDDLEHGDVVMLEVVVDGTDWETGYADMWHLITRKIKT